MTPKCRMKTFGCFFVAFFAQYIGGELWFLSFLGLLIVVILDDLVLFLMLWSWLFLVFIFGYGYGERGYMTALIEKMGTLMENGWRVGHENSMI